MASVTDGWAFWPDHENNEFSVNIRRTTRPNVNAVTVYRTVTATVSTVTNANRSTTLTTSLDADDFYGSTAERTIFGRDDGLLVAENSGNSSDDGRPTNCRNPNAPHTHDRDGDRATKYKFFALRTRTDGHPRFRRTGRRRIPPVIFLFL